MKKFALLLVIVVLSITIMSTFVLAGSAFDSNLVVDFNDVEVDYDIINDTDNYFRDYWVCVKEHSSSAATIKADTDGDKYVDFSSFQWTYYDYDQGDEERELAESYTFKFDIMGATTKANALGVTIRGSYESAKTSIPTYDASGSKRVPWSENDGAGKDSNGTGSTNDGQTGASGISIRLCSVSKTSTDR